MEINVYDFEQKFKNMDRDYYSLDGYQALFDYYDELEDFSLDVIAICCEVSEYTEEELIKDYGYKLDKDDYKDEEGFLITGDYMEDLKQKLQDNTMFIELDNGNFLVWAF